MQFKRLWRETAWLGISSLFCRLLGMIPRFFLPRWVGLETIGLFQMVYPFLLFCITFVCGGFPYVIARWIANEAHLKKKIIQIAWEWVFKVGLPIVFVILVSTPIIVKTFYQDQRLLYPMILIPWVVLIIAMSCVYRGIALGTGQLKWSGISQIAETLFRVFIGTTLTVIAYHFGGVIWGAFALMASMLLGEWVAFFVWRQARFMSDTDSISNSGISSQSMPKSSIQFNLKSLFQESLPFVGLRFIGTIAYWLESIWIPFLLVRNHVNLSDIVIGIGAIQGTLIPIIWMPSAITGALSSGLYTAIANAEKSITKKEAVIFLKKSLLISIAIGVPIHLLLIYFANSIASFVFHDLKYADWLQILLIGSWVVYFQGIFQSVLQASQRAGAAMVNTLIGVIIKFVCVIIFLELGIDPWKSILYSISVSMIATTIFAAWQCRHWLISTFMK